MGNVAFRVADSEAEQPVTDSQVLLKGNVQVSFGHTDLQFSATTDSLRLYSRPQEPGKWYIMQEDVERIAIESGMARQNQIKRLLGGSLA